jgi:hypothetical protein
VAADAAPARVAQILTVLSRQLAAQRVAGRRYLDRRPLCPPWTSTGRRWPRSWRRCRRRVCAMPEMLRGLYGNPGPIVAPALDPALLEHRDRIYRDTWNSRSR